MANGFTYESPLNRLLSVTIPRLIEGQLQREQRQREFDEQMEFREMQFEAAERRRDQDQANFERNFEAAEDQREQQQTNFELLRQDRISEKDALEAEKNALETEKNEIFSVQSVKEASTVGEAMSMLNALEGTIKTNVGRNHFEREKAKLGRLESQRGATLNLFKDYLSEDDMQALKSSFGVKEIKPSEVLSYISADLQLEDLQTNRQLDRIKEQFDMQNNMLTIASRQLNNIPPAILGEEEPKAISDQRELLLTRMTNASNSLTSLFEQYNNILTKSGKEAPQITTPLQDELGPRPLVPRLGRDITSSDLEKLPIGATFEIDGMRVMKAEGGQYMPSDDGDFELINDFIKSDDDLKKDVYIDGVPAVEEPSPEPIEPLSVGVDDEGALGRLAGREAEYETPMLEDIGAKLGDLLRLAPSQQEMMGTGEGSIITYGGAPSDDIKGIRQLEKGLKSTISDLKSDISSYARAPNPPTEATDKEYIQGVDKKNKELQFLLRNGYQALVSTKNARIKRAIKKSLDRAISEIESEIFKSKKIQERRGFGQRVYSITPIISEDTISVINAIKSSTELPEQAKIDTELPEQAKIDEESEVSGLLNFLQNAYNESAVGMADEIYTGERRFPYATEPSSGLGQLASSLTSSFTPMNFTSMFRLLNK